MATKNNQTGLVFHIQRFSLHDGPGIRTMVFLKGCPLSCKWCSNPEGLSNQIEIKHISRNCISCRACLDKCPHQSIREVWTDTKIDYPIVRESCRQCGTCVKFCPTGAKQFCGEVRTVDDIVQQVQRDLPFYKAGQGGVTISGGELLSQAAFSYEILKRCKALGVSTAIETSGFGKQADLLRIGALCDTIHFDLKVQDDYLHQQMTDQSNRIILKNVIALDQMLLQLSKKPTFILRVPLVLGYTATLDNVEQIAKFIKRHLKACDLVELLTFHNLGEHKYKELDLPYELAEKENGQAGELEFFAEIMRKSGFPVKISSL